MRGSWLKIFCIIWWMSFLACWAGFGADASSASSSSSPRKDNGGPDPFVASAPLIIAAECSDGVAMIALHTAFADEPLLLDDTDVPIDSDQNQSDESSSIATRDVDANTTSTNETVHIHDIPRSYRGPFRIYSIDSFGTSMVFAGWRPHGQMVADHCRDLAKEELKIYGNPRMTMKYCLEYGQYLARQTSLWMAYASVLNMHSWSCAGILATCSGNSRGINETSLSSTGALWLVDSTGAYRVRAHAVGGGALAAAVNQYLAQRILGNSSTGDDLDEPVGAEQMLRDILSFLSKQHSMIPSGTRVELAVITAESATGKARLKRVFTSRLFGVEKASS